MTVNQNQYHYKKDRVGTHTTLGDKKTHNIHSSSKNPKKIYTAEQILQFSKKPSVQLTSAGTSKQIENEMLELLAKYDNTLSMTANVQEYLMKTFCSPELKSIFDNNTDLTGSLLLYDPYKSIDLIKVLSETNTYIAQLAYQNEKRKTLYCNRLLYLYKMSNIDKAFVNEDNKVLFEEYYSLGFHPNSCKVATFKEGLTKIPSSMLDIIIDVIRNKQEDHPMYKDVLGIINMLTDVSNHRTLLFKKAYKCFKNILNSTYTRYQIHEEETFHKVNILLGTTIISKGLGLPKTPTDNKVIITLFRLYISEPLPNEKYPEPLYTAIQKNQIDAYIEEIVHILHITVTQDLKNKVVPNILEKFLKKLPITFILNKPTALFFGKPMSTTTFGLLLDYLHKVNIALLATLQEHLTQYKRDSQ